MREIRTSGSTRGRRAADLICYSSSYSTGHPSFSIRSRQSPKSQNVQSSLSWRPSWSLTSSQAIYFQCCRRWAGSPAGKPAYERACVRLPQACW